jgi:hypothetical protein
VAAQMTGKRASQEADNLGIQDLQRKVQDVASKVTAAADLRKAQNQQEGKEQGSGGDEAREDL